MSGVIRKLSCLFLPFWIGGQKRRSLSPREIEGGRKEGGLLSRQYTEQKRYWSCWPVGGEGKKFFVVRVSRASFFGGKKVSGKVCLFRADKEGEDKFGTQFFPLSSVRDIDSHTGGKRYISRHFCQRRFFSSF